MFIQHAVWPYRGLTFCRLAAKVYKGLEVNPHGLYFAKTEKAFGPLPYVIRYFVVNIFTCFTWFILTTLSYHIALFCTLQELLDLAKIRNLIKVGPRQFNFYSVSKGVDLGPDFPRKTMPLKIFSLFCEEKNNVRRLAETILRKSAPHPQR